MKKIFAYLGFFLLCVVSYGQTKIAQKLAPVDSVSIKRANNAIDKVLGIELEDRTFLVFSIDDKVLLIHKSCGVYKLYAFVEMFNYDAQENVLQEKKKRKVKKDKMLDSVFSTTVCKQQFTYSGTNPLSQKLAHWDTRYIYFIVSKNGKKTCEFNLPVSYKIDVSNEGFIPIRQEVFDYLVKKLITMTAAHKKSYYRGQ